jgi:hypothetical protein
LLSVSRRNHRLMWVTSVSATSGIGLVVVLSPFGVVAVATGLALKNAAMVAWMAVLTRRDFPRSVPAYAAVVGLPFAAMLVAGYGAHAGLATLMVGSEGGQLGVLGLSGCAVLVAGLTALVPSLSLPVGLRSLNPFRRPGNTKWSIAP